MKSAQKIPEQRPELPDFWCKRFKEGITPWDAGGVPKALQHFVEQHRVPQATLIPGCGSAWEAAWLGAQGWPVMAVDFSPEAIQRAREVLEQISPALQHNTPWEERVTLHCADFFTFAPPRPVTFIYERAFLCALPRKLWVDWGKRMAELLSPGGLLGGFFFFNEAPKGPPFGISREQLDALLGPNFDRIEDIPVNDSIPVFAGKERWQVWCRR